MLRLKSPAFERFFQSPALEATFGGGEANVSVSLANYGMDTAYVTVLPNNDIGNACIRELRGFGVDVSNIVRKEGRMGIYYLESGAVQVKELISHELPLEDYGKGLDYIVQKQARKVIIHP